MFLRRQKLMEIFVTDKCSGEEPFPTITVEMDKKATLAELKAAVLSKFPSGIIIIYYLFLFVSIYLFIQLFSIYIIILISLLLFALTFWGVKG